MTRTLIRHQPIADGLRTLPGQWGLVGNYRWNSAAKTAANNITTGRLASYQPAGSFEAEIRHDDEGDAHVYARWVGIPGALAARAAADYVRALMKEGRS